MSVDFFLCSDDGWGQYRGTGYPASHRTSILHSHQGTHLPGVRKCCIELWCEFHSMPVVSCTYLLVTSFTEWLWWQFQSDWIQHCSCTNCTVQTVSPLALLMTHSRESCVVTSVFSTCSGWPPHCKCLTVTHTTTYQSREQVNAVLYIIVCTAYERETIWQWITIGFGQDTVLCPPLPGGPCLCRPK